MKNEYSCMKLEHSFLFVIWAKKAVASYIQNSYQIFSRLFLGSRLLFWFHYLTRCIHLTTWFFLQAAYQAGEDEVSLSTMGRSYTIDFNSMQQINEDTGTARPVQRKLNSFGVPQPTGMKVIVFFISVCYCFVY